MFDLERGLSFVSVFSGSSPRPSSAGESMVRDSKAGVLGVLVDALADPSLPVRHAAIAALSQPDNARENALLLLEICTIVLQRGRRKGAFQGSHMAAVLSVMAKAVDQMKNEALEIDLARRISQLAMIELANSKDIESEWQQAASNLLVSVGRQMPDVMIQEVFKPPPGAYLPIVGVIKCLTQFAEKDASLMVPRLNLVLSHVLPVLGRVEKRKRYIFAEAIGSWCDAISHFEANHCFDVSKLEAPAGIQSVFDLFSSRWINTNDPTTRSAVISSLGRMAPLVSRSQLKASIPKLLPSLLSMYKKKGMEHQTVTKGIRSVFLASLAKEKGQPLVDFQALVPVLNCILPKASYFPQKDMQAESPVAILKNCNEVLGCFTVAGAAFPEETCSFLIQRLSSGDDSARAGSLAVLRYLIFWLEKPWQPMKGLVFDAVLHCLEEEDLNLRKALAQVIVAMAANNFFCPENAEPFIRFLVWQTRAPQSDSEDGERVPAGTKLLDTVLLSTSPKNFEKFRFGNTSYADLCFVSEKCLHLISTTLPEIRRAIFPTFLKVLIPRRYTGAISTVCMCIAELSRPEIINNPPLSFHSLLDGLTYGCPPSQILLARMMVLLEDPFCQARRAGHVLEVLRILGPCFHNRIVDTWTEKVQEMQAFLRMCSSKFAIAAPETDSLRAKWNELVIQLLSESLTAVPTDDWAVSLSNSFAAQYDLYNFGSSQTALLHRCLGLTVQRVESKSFVLDKIDLMYRRSNIADSVNREGLAMGMGLVAANHVDTVLGKLRKILETEGRSWIRWLLSLLAGRKGPSADDVCASLALMYGYVASYAPSQALEARVDRLVGTNVLIHLIDVYTPEAKRAVITAIDLLAKAVRRAASEDALFWLKKRDDMIGYIMNYMDNTGFSSDPQLLQTQALALTGITDLVLVSPPVGVVIRDRIIQAVLPLLNLPSEPDHLVRPLMSNLSLLLCSMISTCESEAEKLTLIRSILLQLSPFFTSKADSQRLRSCDISLALTEAFLASATVASNQGPPPGSECGPSSLAEAVKETEELSQIKSDHLSSATSYETGELLSLVLPRCHDSSRAVQDMAAQVVVRLFDISSHLESTAQHSVPSAMASNALKTLALSESKEDMSRFRKLVSVLAVVLRDAEVNSYLGHIARYIVESDSCGALGIVFSAARFLHARGQIVNSAIIEPFVFGVVSAAAAVSDKNLRQKTLALVLNMAEISQKFHTAVLSSLLFIIERESTVSRGGPYSSRKEFSTVREAIELVACHSTLGGPSLDHFCHIVDGSLTLSVNETDRIRRVGSWARNEAADWPKCATLALGIVLGMDDASVTATVATVYCNLFCCFLRRLARIRAGVEAGSGSQALKDLLCVVVSFAEITSDFEMKDALSGDYSVLSPDWPAFIANLASCQAKSHPNLVPQVCERLLSLVDSGSSLHERTVIAACLSEYSGYCEDDRLADELVGKALLFCEESASLARSLAAKSIRNLPERYLQCHSEKLFPAILALVADQDDDVALSAILGIPKLIKSSAVERVNYASASLLQALSRKQESESEQMRCAAFSAVSALLQLPGLSYSAGLTHTIHSGLPTVLFHTNDDSPGVRAAAKLCVRSLGEVFSDSSSLLSLTQSQFCESDKRWQFDDFVQNFAYCLAVRPLESNLRLEMMAVYLSTSLEILELSPFPRVQCGAAIFCSHFLKNFDGEVGGQAWISKACELLTRMMSTCRSSEVKVKTAAALSTVLGILRN